jgi:hypothetical protein
VKTRPVLTVLGSAALLLAGIGTLSSISVMVAGGTEGLVYLIVNATLAVLGVVFLFLAARRTSPKVEKPDQRTNESP